MGNVVPGAVVDPGVHWDSSAGTAQMLTVRWHYTVGYDSSHIGRDLGLFGFLIARDGTLFQFSLDDSVDWDACEWNRFGKGVEIESIDGSITPEQIATLGYLTTWLITNYGIPANFYDGERLPVGAWQWFQGVVNHRALVHNACDQHYDGFDQWVWEAAMSPAPSPGPTPGPSTSRETYMIVADSDGTAYVPGGAFVIGETGVRYIGDPVELARWTYPPTADPPGMGMPMLGMPGASINTLPRVPGSYGAPTPTPPDDGSGDALTPAEIAALAKAANDHIQSLAVGRAQVRAAIGDDVQGWLPGAVIAAQS